VRSWRQNRQLRSPVKNEALSEVFSAPSALEALCDNAYKVNLTLTFPVLVPVKLFWNICTRYTVVVVLYVTAGGELPDALQQVMLPVIDNEVCNQPGWYDNNLDDTMVCAGYEEGELGNCQVSFRSE